MAAAEVEEGAQVERTGIVGELVQAEHQRCFLEEIGCLSDFLGQLPVQAPQVVAEKLQHGHGEHVALELEDGVAFGRIGCGHSGYLCLDGGTYSGMPCVSQPSSGDGGRDCEGYGKSARGL